MEEEDEMKEQERRDSIRDDDELVVVFSSSASARASSSLSLARYDDPSGRATVPFVDVGDLLRLLGSRVLDCIPLSVLFDLVESACDLSISTVFAAGGVGTSIAGRVVSSLFDAILFVVDVASRLNPLSIVDFVLSAQRHAVGKTGDVLVSGIQSVATGVGSVSNAALNRLSRGGLAVLAGGEAMMMGGSRSNGYGHHRVVVMRKDASAVAVRDNLMEKNVSLVFYRIRDASAYR
jgi:hypothetical protein